MNVFLDKLELHGFKSFPEKTVVRFHRGITAVVGPNGCGKSNIVDAILWVLGEQRIKNLRGENNEDLIFNGSSSKKPLGMTEVAATFQTDGEPVYLARRFYRTGDGKYVHNERLCRHKDIQDELFKMNLGGTGYYIFEQGSIEKLLALKPTEQRALIEEAAGIAKYLERKKETAGKLIVSVQNLENIDILLADKGERLKELRNQVNYVQRYRKAKEEWQKAQRTLIHRKYRTFSAEFERHQRQIEAHLNDESLLGREFMALESRVLEGEERRWRLDQQLKESQKKAYEINRSLTALKGEFEQYVQRQGFLRQRVAELLQINEKGGNEMAELGAQLTESDDSQRQGGQALKMLERELESLTLAQKALADGRAGFLLKEKDLQRRLFEAQAELSRTGNGLREIEKNLMRAENDVLARQNVIQALKEQDRQKDQRELITQLAQLTAELEMMTERQQTAEKEVNNARVRQQEADENCRSLAASLQSLTHTRSKVLELKVKMAKTDVGGGPFPGAVCLQEQVDARPEDRAMLESFYYDLMDAPLVDGLDAALIARLDKAKITRVAAEIDWEALSRQEGCEGTVRDFFSMRGSLDKSIFPNGLVVRDLSSALRIFIQYGVPLVTRDGTSVSTEGLLFRKREKGVLDVLAEIRRLEVEQIETEELLAKARAQKLLCDDTLKAAQHELNKAQEARREVEKELMRLRSDSESLRRQDEQNRRRIELTQTEITMALENRQELEEARLESQKRLAEAEDRLKNVLAEKESFQGESQAAQLALTEQEKRVLQKRHECQLQGERSEAALLQNRRLSQQIARLKAQMEQNDDDTRRFTAEADEQDANKAKNRDQVVLLQRERTQLEQQITADEKGLDAVGSELRKAGENLGQGRKRLEGIRELRAKEELIVSNIKKDLFGLQELAFKELNLELRDVEPDTELAELDLAGLIEQTRELDDRLRKMRDSDRLNFSAESEYDLLMKEHGFLESQKEDVLSSIADMNQAMAKIDSESRQKFNVAFKEISENFITNFKILFEGGEAELSLLDPENVLETGLEIKAQPPGKRLQGLRLLSGGEKTLTSLAFLFALFQYKPSPFCVFDEVDASLDEANIQRFLKFLHALKVNTQFLIITHNFKTMEEADFIYGISMNEPGISSVYSMKLTGRETLERVDN